MKNVLSFFILQILCCFLINNAGGCNSKTRVSNVCDSLIERWELLPKIKSCIEQAETSEHFTPQVQQSWLTIVNEAIVNERKMRDNPSNQEAKRAHQQFMRDNFLNLGTLYKGLRLREEVKKRSQTSEN